MLWVVVVVFVVVLGEIWHTPRGTLTYACSAHSIPPAPLPTVDATTPTHARTQTEGLDYLRDTLGYELNYNLKQYEDSNLDIKGTTGADEDDTLIKFNLLTVCQKVFVAIAESTGRVPNSFRHVFHHVRSEMDRCFGLDLDDLMPIVVAGLVSSLDETTEAFEFGDEAFDALANLEREVNNDRGHLAQTLPAMRGAAERLGEHAEALRKQSEKMRSGLRDLRGTLNADPELTAKIIREHTNQQNSIAVGGFFFLRFLVPAITGPLFFFFFFFFFFFLLFCF